MRRPSASTETPVCGNFYLGQGVTHLSLTSSTARRESYRAHCLVQPTPLHKYPPHEYGNEQGFFGVETLLLAGCRAAGDVESRSSPCEAGCGVTAGRARDRVHLHG